MFGNRCSKGARLGGPTAFIALLMLFLATVSWAQGNPSGKLIGKVVVEGVGVPGVLLTATSPNLQGSRTAITGPAGDYFLASLPPGPYDVTLSMEGMNEQQLQVQIAAAQTTYQNATMTPLTLTEEVLVTAEPTGREVISAVPLAATTMTKKLIDELPTGRTLNQIAILAPGVTATGPGKSTTTGLGAISISGAPSFENLFVINGVVVNENIRGQAFDLFIEDAIQETTAATAAISAEYGRFSGGVVNLITKSGGNKFAGSFRTSLTNQDWVSKTALTTAVTDEVIPVYEATLGGPVLRDRLWFFAAGRDFNTETTGQTISPTSLPFAVATDQQRYEAKITGRLTESHTVVGTYMTIDQVGSGQFFGAILDLASVYSREDPQELAALNYSGILTPSFLLTAQYSERAFQIANAGATTRDRISGTLMLDQSRGLARYFAPTFCGICRAEDRNNENLLAKASYFLSSERFGTHDIAFGYDRFNDIRAADNHQSGSDFRVFGTGAIIRGDQIFPVFDENTVVQFNPIARETEGTNFITNSLYLNDTWRQGDRWTFNLGLRYDANDGENAEGKAVAKDSNLSPRLAARFSPSANWSVHASMGRYVAALANSVGDSTSAAGAPATLQWAYGGPDVNLGNPSNPLTTAQALQILFDWFDGAGGANNSRDLIFANIPGGSAIIRDSLVSPSVDEITVGFTRQLGSRGFLRADLIDRTYANFYTTRIDTATGSVETPNGVVDLALIENRDSAFSRDYSAAQIQASYNLGSRLNLGANYTWSHLRGNFDGESRNSGPVTGDLTYPEFKLARFDRPDGDLGSDQRHKAIFYSTYQIVDGGRVRLSASAVQSFNSGVPYGAVGAAPTRNSQGAFFITNPGYRTPPRTVTYYFTARDANRTEDILRTDLALNLSFRLKALELFVHPEVINLFDADNIDTTDSRFLNQSVFSSTNTGATSCSQAGPNGGPGRCQPFNPYTDTPIEGVHWQKGPQFGQPISPLGFQTPRTYRFSVGVRF